MAKKDKINAQLHTLNNDLFDILSKPHNRDSTKITKVLLFDYICNYFKKLERNGIIDGYAIDDYTDYSNDNTYVFLFIKYKGSASLNTQSICIKFDLWYNIFQTLWKLHTNSLFTERNS